ncbi:RNA-guided pseudouridylation complex pseudouridine synthase subunit Cbf5 [Haloarcula pellucida]|uniref:Probable tRNA pseudouridine synthase B n=1 Tax=Haloarcula pellucida TaxID=1427151 RepID=A0A830GMF6_9EURY|nr:RNA-guided pseudouridylation complex pseudouridine synthase subunit Cbf5 [Halomicroarcula pellucida]MBX0348405.1 RNA-guided pseudouridylation complex pseudouridine synthase subunit Cbf5 [Halomicroarcula pellucida]GGN93530.1 tRNA pseudouridine(55) synthase TruB [Halomicroarcula pellucida]
MTLRGPPDDRDVDALLSFGVVNLDKPPGPSAHQVAAWVRDATGQDRVAHGGTLDPKVTGCLPILLGDAARAARVFDEAIKEYVAVLELHDRAPADFGTVVAEFEGDIYQKPPRKSAVKRQLRTRRIHDLDVLEREDRRALLRVRCASGTYIRKLCHDIGLALGTGAHMGDLRRTATGTFDDADLVTMHDLVDALAVAEAGETPPLREVVQPAERALVALPAVTIAPSAARAVADGAPVYAPGVIGVGPAEVGGATPEEGTLVACYTPDGAAVCLGTLVGDPETDAGTVVELERVLV